MAENKFFKILSLDWRAPAATFATDYLKKILRDTDAIKISKKKFDDLVEVGSIRPAHFSPEHVGFFAGLKLPGHLEEHLSNLLKLGGLVAARTSLVGVMMNEIGLTDPAAYFVDHAQSLAEQVQKKAIRVERKIERDRPLHFTFSRVLEKSEYPTLDVNQLSTIPFAKRLDEGDSDVDAFVITSLHETKKISRLKLAYLNFRDSNAIRLGDTSGLPVGISRKAGSDPIYFAGYEAQSDPTRRMSYGGMYSFISRQKSRTELDPYTASSHVPSLWVSWWNARNLELRVRYDYAISKIGSSRSDLSSRTHGPSLHVIRDFGNKGRAQFSLSQAANVGESDGRNGSEYVARMNFVTRNEKNGFEPRLGYAYRRNVAMSGVFNSSGSEVRAGTAMPIGDRAVLDFETTLRWTSFSRSPGSVRSDTLKVFELRGVFPMGRSQLSFLGGAVYEIQGSSLSSAAYSRWAVGGGATAAFDW